MRPSGLSKFRKTLGRIDQDLPVGIYEITTDNCKANIKYDLSLSILLNVSMFFLS